MRKTRVDEKKKNRNTHPNLTWTGNDSHQIPTKFLPFPPDPLGSTWIPVLPNSRWIPGGFQPVQPNTRWNHSYFTTFQIKLWITWSWDIWQIQNNGKKENWTLDLRTVIFPPSNGWSTNCTISACRYIKIICYIYPSSLSNIICSDIYWTAIFTYYTSKWPEK